jgi:hypothetical protein
VKVSLGDVIDEYLIQEEARERNSEYFTNLTLWAFDKFGIILYWKQEEMALSLVENHDTAVKAGHGVGKSFFAALAVCWWIDTRPIEKVFAATTAPSQDQVAGILWREIRRFHALSHKLAKADKTGLYKPLPGYITQENKWKGDLGELLAQGRKPPDNKSEDAFQGFHDGYVLAIGDEACGLSESMIDGLSNITTNETSRRLLIGNPTNPSSYFGKIFKDDTGAWRLHTISVLDSPNFHGGGRCSCHIGHALGLNMTREALGNLTDQSFVDSKKLEYGEDSPRYRSRVMGEFAYDAGNTLWNDYDLANARNTVILPTIETPYRVLGVDVARFGADSTYVYMAEWGTVQKTDDETNAPLGKDKLDENGLPIVGIKLRYVAHWKDAPITDRTLPDGTFERGTATMVNELAVSLGVREVRVDASGLGGGVIDGMYDLAQNRYDIYEMVGNNASPDRRTWINFRAYQMDAMRRMGFQGTLDLDPTDENLIDELGGIQYEFSETAGGMKIEAKESMKKRGVKSPDAADAAWYACADLDYLTKAMFPGARPGDVVTQSASLVNPSSFYDYTGW